LTPLAVGLLQLPCPPSAYPPLPLPPLFSFPKKDPPAPNHIRNFRAWIEEGVGESIGLLDGGEGRGGRGHGTDRREGGLKGDGMG